MKTRGLITHFVYKFKQKRAQIIFIYTNIMARGFIDCHCHLSADEFTQTYRKTHLNQTHQQDIDDVLLRAKRAGVKALVAVTEGASEFEKVILLSKTYPGFVFPCFGIHPLQGSGQDLHSVKIQDLEPFLPLFQKYRADIVAVSEIGLDFTPWFAKTTQERDEQIKVFIKQLEISKELDLPVNVHSRSAAKVTIDTMKELGIRQALLHNFAGKPSVAMEGVQAGFCFSFPPAVSKTEQRAKLIRQIPLEHICLETDSPALGIDKHIRNEPGNIMICCEYIAKIKGISSDAVMEVTTQNALRLFSKLKR
ncbi:putative deoxyribonuclease tatdn3 isoform X1 [Carassius gibelio]|uniref:putative deoxyribonuclease tatdn3 isoform X1 n=1 Tax=Carassius gibelio TaxID=101364 RepID=UPI0022791176|nr:putative deoxyribonuclease tatdn3 isoform X1 [Carassius gibelio]